MPGRYNALNAAAVIALISGTEKTTSRTETTAAGLDHASGPAYSPGDIQQALDAFKGVSRRQEVRGVADGVTVVDDFAHHPTAVGLTIEAMRGRYPGQRLWAVFEPRSFTARGGRFQREFTEALAGADHVVLARPFTSDTSAGVVPLDVGAIAAELQYRGLEAEAMADTDAILAHLNKQTRPGDVVLIMSNGGFEDIHTRLLAALHQRIGAQGAPQTTTAHP